MSWNYPVTITLGEDIHPIRNNCDYRVILDIINVLNDEELPRESRYYCALKIFYPNFSKITDYNEALKKMITTISLGESAKNDTNSENNQKKLMDWEYDFNLIAPPISRVLGYSVRNPSQYVHWYDFVDAYMEIGGECTFVTVTRIRKKLWQCEKLDDFEKKFLKENAKLIYLPSMSKDDSEWLNSDW